MTEPTAKELMLRWLKMIQCADFADVAEVLDENVVAHWPQSREKVVGLKNLVEILRNYPGGALGTNLEKAHIEDVASEHYLMTPMFTTVKVEGTGNKASGSVLTRYPDGTDWYIVMTAEMRNGKIIQNDAFFAPVYDAPEWRAKWVERMADDE